MLLGKFFLTVKIGIPTILKLHDFKIFFRLVRSAQTVHMFLVVDFFSFKAEVHFATTAPLVESVIAGYNATIFAYGATGN